LSLTDDLTPMIAAEAQALGFDLVRVKLFAGGDRTLQVMAERPDTRQLNIDDCAALSRAISERLEALEEAGKDPIDGAYRLEVSSPGIDRPLTRRADFADWAGHEVRISVVEAVGGLKTVKGDIVGIDGDIVSIADTKHGTQRIAFDNIHSAKLKLTDALIASTAPLAQDGAEFIEEEEGQD
jgi:ribosome maturation factor RimP